MSTFIALMILVVAKFTFAETWSYEAGPTGPQNWYQNYPTCNGNKQSPININPATVIYSSNLPPFTFDNYDTDDDLAMTAVNNGHTVRVDIAAADDFPTIEDGGLPDKYIAVQFHFHWGSDSSKGSEHTVGGTKYPLEMHIVHMRESEVDFATAAQNPNGLAVLGVLFEIDSQNNANYDNVINKLDSIVNKGSEVVLDPFPLEDLLPADKDKFWRYDGGLTTPGCYESVIWTVFQDTVKVSEAQLQELRQLSQKSGGVFDPLVNNFRPVQNLAGRTVLSSDDD